MAFPWSADDGPTLIAGLVAAIFQGIRTCVARKPYIFVIFQAGVGTPGPPLDPHMLSRFWFKHIFKNKKKSHLEIQTIEQMNWRTLGPEALAEH